MTQEQPAGIGNARFGADRAVELMRTTEAEMALGPVPTATTADRFVGRLIDFAIALALLALVASAYSAIRYGGGADDAETPGDATRIATIAWGAEPIRGAHVAGFALIFGTLFVYEVGATVAAGQTVGKRIASTRIVSADRSPATARQVVVRTLAWGVPLAVVLTMYFISMLYAWTSIAVLVALVWWMRRDPRGIALHERLSGTEVVDDERLAASREPAATAQ